MRDRKPLIATGGQDEPVPGLIALHGQFGALEAEIVLGTASLRWGLSGRSVYQRLMGTLAGGKKARPFNPAFALQHYFRALWSHWIIPLTAARAFGLHNCWPSNDACCRQSCVLH